MIRLPAPKLILLTVLLLSVAAIVLAWSFVGSQKDSIVALQLLPADLKWKRNPNLPGWETAVLAGHPPLPRDYMPKESRFRR
jgi:hypothetical protein